MLRRLATLASPTNQPARSARLRAVIPLCMTGTVVDNAQYASTEEIMRYTLSNIQPGSSKLW